MTSGTLVFSAILALLIAIPVMATDAVFVSVRGRRLTHAPALQTLRALSMTAGLSEPMPRLHDLRHCLR